MVLGLLLCNVGFATVEEEDALIKSGEIKVGMSFSDFRKLPIVFDRKKIKETNRKI